MRVRVVWIGLLMLCGSPARAQFMGRSAEALGAWLGTREQREADQRHHAELHEAGLLYSRYQGLEELELPILEVAVDRPELLWEFLIHPDTPFQQRLAAALRCGPVFPVEYLPRLMAAIGELEHERELHDFGLRAHPHASAARWSFPDPPMGWPEPLTSWNARFSVAEARPGEWRHPLGFAWQVPEQRMACPLSRDEECAAPWPWQVHQALERVYRSIMPNCTTGERTRQWLAQCLAMPLASDSDARYFLRAAAGSRAEQSLAVLARCRSIALDPRFPLAARQVPRYLGDVYERWDDADGRLACQVVAEDILRNSPFLYVRQDCSWSLFKLARVATSPVQNHPARVPSGAILAARDLACGELPLSDWSRLYTVFGICDVLEQPPFASERNLDPRSERVGELLALFRAWSTDLEQRLEREQQRELEREAALRAELERLAS